MAGAVKSAIRLRIEFAVAMRAERGKRGKLGTSANDEKAQGTVLGVDTIRVISASRPGINDVPAA
jgi:hypothetical protein